MQLIGKLEWLVCITVVWVLQLLGMDLPEKLQ